MKNLNEINEKTLEIGNKDYSVIICPRLTVYTDDLGNIDYRKQIINLDEDLINRPKDMLEVMLHEIQHALNERFGLMDIKDEEQFVNQQAVALATVLIRNKWLADFIAIAAKG